MPALRHDFLLAEEAEVPKGRIPRISKLTALAITFDRLIRGGFVAKQAEIAKLGLVSRARVTQIIDPLNLAPDIQEALLSLPRMKRGAGSGERAGVRAVVAEADSWHTPCRKPV